MKRPGIACAAAPISLHDVIAIIVHISLRVSWLKKFAWKIRAPRVRQGNNNFTHTRRAAQISGAHYNIFPQWRLTREHERNLEIFYGSHVESAYYYNIN